MRKIIAYLATSANGFIARPDGDVGWLDRPRPKGNYGYAAFDRSVDTVVMGRKTYDFMVGFGQHNVPGKQTYVFSRHPPPPTPPDVAFVSHDVRGFARRLRRQRGRTVWHMGGGELIGAFLDAGALDELIIHVVPVLIGEGIPLLDPRRREIRLTLKGSRRFADGVVRLHYLVGRGRRRSTVR